LFKLHVYLLDASNIFFVLITFDNQGSWFGTKNWCCNCSWNQSDRDSLCFCTMHCGKLYTNDKLVKN